MNFEYWYLFPVAIAVATTAMASGVGGATFFAPIFILGVGLPAEVAIGTGLITEVFGFASGLYTYARRKLIDYRLGGKLLIVTVPAAILGTLIAGFVSTDLLKIVLGVGLFAVAASFLRSPDRDEVTQLDLDISTKNRQERGESQLTAADGHTYTYTVCNRNEGRAIAGIGGLFVGLISTGLGELNGYFLLQRCRVPSPVAIATSVFVVAITALTAATAHVVQFAQLDSAVLQQVFDIVIFTVPGVVIGAPLGSWVTTRVSQHQIERVLGYLFILVALATLAEVLL